MALKLSLRPKEKLIVGGTVIILKNGDTASELIIENRVPVLIREKDIMIRSRADSPCRRIYFIVQMMYLDRENLTEYHGIYWNLVRDVLEAAPSTLSHLDRISEDILSERYYRALKKARALLEYEEALVRTVHRPEEFLVQNSRAGEARQ